MQIASLAWEGPTTQKIRGTPIAGGKALNPGKRCGYPPLMEIYIGALEEERLSMSGQVYYIYMRLQHSQQRVIRNHVVLKEISVRTLAVGDPGRGWPWGGRYRILKFLLDSNYSAGRSGLLHPILKKATEIACISVVGPSGFVLLRFHAHSFLQKAQRIPFFS